MKIKTWNEKCMYIKSENREKKNLKFDKMGERLQ